LGKADLSGLTASSNEQLRKCYFHFIENRTVFAKFLDLELFNHELDRGLYLESNIPQRYGMGSSGALCAALYDRYRLDVAFQKNNHIRSEIMDQSHTGENLTLQEQTLINDPDKLAVLRSVFISMESLFHGRSSGFDPLVSFLKTPLLVRRDGFVSPVDLQASPVAANNVKILLIDSCCRGATGPLVNEFLVKYAPGGNTTDMGEIFRRLTNGCISSMFDVNPEPFFDAISQLSCFQVTELSYLIPSHLLGAWSEGLLTGLFSLKLCGSGGGGFLLCFTRHEALTLNYFNDLKIPVIPVQL
jgi:mevalonate kinase